MTELGAQYPVSGSCQCGATRYELLEAPTMVGACHCLECQKLSASAFSLTMVVTAKGFRVLSGGFRSWNRETDRGGTVLCYFCHDCGNRIYHKNPDAPDYLRVKAGGLENNSMIQPQVHFFTKRAQSWVVIPEDVLQFEGQPSGRELSEALAARARSQ
jgi:hypothetical protein